MMTIAGNGDIYHFFGWSNVAGVRFALKCGLYLSVAGKRGAWFWEIHPQGSARCYICGRERTLLDALRYCEDYAEEIAEGCIDQRELRAA